MLDPDVIEQLADHLTAAELVDFLDLSIDQIIDAFEPEIDAKLPQLQDVYGLTY